MAQLIGYFGKFFCWTIIHLPYSIQMAIGDLIGLLWFDVFRIRRPVVLENLQIAFPEMSPDDRIKLGRRSMREFGRNLVEYCHLPFLQQPSYANKFYWHGREHLQNALLKGSGVLLLTLHMGNGDLAIGGMALGGFPVYVVSKVFHTKWLNELWFGLRERIGARFIPPRQSSFSILKALKKNGVVIFVLDQYTGAPIGVPVRFFGREAGTGMGLAVMAERSGAAVVPAYTLRRPDGGWDIFMEEEIPFSSSSNPDESLARMTQIYTEHLEQYVKRCPEQWMWLHRRWKEFS